MDLFYSSEQVNFFVHPKPVFGLSVDATNNSIVSTACEDGYVRIYDVRMSDDQEPMKTPQSRAPYHSGK